MLRKKKYKPTLETIPQNDIFVPSSISEGDILYERIQLLLEEHHLTPCSMVIFRSKLFQKLSEDFLLLEKKHPLYETYFEILRYLSVKKYSKIIMDYIDVHSYKYSKLNGPLSKQNIIELYRLLKLPKVHFTKREEIELKNHMSYIHQEEEKRKVIQNKIIR